MNKLIIANWKMNLTAKESLVFAKAVKNNPHTQAVIAAPFVFLADLKKALPQYVKLAAQNVSQFEPGAYTGEISAQMLKEAGCSFCLAGHSERRIYFQESDSQVNLKAKNLLKYGIKPVICLGENAEQRKRGMTKQILKKQLQGALAGISDFKNIVIAYEPVWAISTFQKAKTAQCASLADIASAHNYLRSLVKGKITIIYGGTVNPQNCQAILNLKEVDGALVGGASLKVSSFNAIIQSAN